jgi:hypothetical protein
VWIRSGVSVTSCCVSSRTTLRVTRYKRRCLQLIVAQLVKMFPVFFFGTWRYITVFTKAHH